MADEKIFSHSAEEQVKEGDVEEKNVTDHGVSVPDNAEGDDQEQEQLKECEEEEISLDFLQQKIEQMEREKEELTNRLLRLQADFDNYRKRIRAEKEDLINYAVFNFVQKMLPVIDNLERACSSDQKNEQGIIEGIKMILKQLLDVLENEGVNPIDCQGKPFDPNCHEAVLSDETPDYPANTVVEELQKGYMMKDKVLRPSMVKVSVDNK